MPPSLSRTSGPSPAGGSALGRMRRFSLFVSISLDETYSSNILLTLLPIYGGLLFRSFSPLPRHPQTGVRLRPRRPIPRGSPTTSSPPVPLHTRASSPPLFPSLPPSEHLPAPVQKMADSQAATLVTRATRSLSTSSVQRWDASREMVCGVNKFEARGSPASPSNSTQRYHHYLSRRIISVLSALR
jgi:hypothetical protein